MVSGTTLCSKYTICYTHYLPPYSWFIMCAFYDIFPPNVLAYLSISLYMDVCMCAYICMLDGVGVILCAWFIENNLTRYDRFFLSPFSCFDLESRKTFFPSSRNGNLRWSLLFGYRYLLSFNCQIRREKELNRKWNQFQTWTKSIFYPNSND